MTTLAGCQLGAHAGGETEKNDDVTIERFDRVESLYLTMADFAALHHMKTDYPTQTRTLIEDVLQLGPVNDPNINTRWLKFFQDSTLQALISDVERQYADIDDVNRQLTRAFRRLSKMLPHMETPKVYAQIGSLDQSIIVTDSMLGISLDKYLGADYPAYLRYGYSEHQRSMMTREYIVPDCLGFYLLSIYPSPQNDDEQVERRRWHMAKIQYVVNQVMGRDIFYNDTIARLQRFMKENPRCSTSDFLMADSLP